MNDQHTRDLIPIDVEIQSLINESRKNSKTIARLNTQSYTLASKNKRLRAKVKELKIKHKDRNNK